MAEETTPEITTETTTGDGKKKTIFIAIGALALVAVLVIVFIIMRSRGKSSTDDTATGTSSAVNPIAPTTATTPLSRGAMPRSGMPGGVMPMGAAPAAAGNPLAATRAISTAAVAPAAPAKPGLYPGAKEPARIDPFVHQPLPPEEIARRRAAAEAARKLAEIMRAQIKPVLPVVNITTSGIRIEGSAEEIATLRRTAGLMWNGQVYGLLQLGDDYYIVRAGDYVGGYKVTAITRDSIVLYSSELRKQIQIPLQGPRAEMPEAIGVTPEAEVPFYDAEPRLGITTPEISESPEYDLDEVAPGMPEFPTY